MKIGFDNIHDHVIPMDRFWFKWRFTDPGYDLLPDIHLSQIKPLDNQAARFLWDYISVSSLHKDIPFAKGFFQTIDKTRITGDNKQQIKKWLYRRALPFDKNVFLSYEPEVAIIVPWKIFIKFFDSFHYSDDLTIIDQSLTWALLFYHEGEIYFGTNKDYKPSETLTDYNFIW